MVHSPVVPAIIPRDAADITSFLAKLPGLHEIHVDVVDGHFVPMISWPYAPLGVPSTLYEQFDPYTLEVDLMVATPLEAARAWVAAGADMLVFHVETISVEAVVAFAASHKITVGVAASSDTPDEVLWAYVPHVDYVQVMGIEAIGQQGQPFDIRALERIHRLKNAFPSLLISIDGSMNDSTIVQAREAGADRYIVGSVIYKAPDPFNAFLQLTNLVSSTD